MNPQEMKNAVKKGEIIFGMQQFLPSPSVTEIIGKSGFDFVMICTEHGTVGYGQELENCIRASVMMGMTPFVRVTENRKFLIHRALECGAKGIMIPLVKTKDDVKKAISAIKFPPVGKRGICPMSKTFLYKPDNPSTFSKDENDITFTVPFIEHIKAVENIHDILTVSYIDFIFFGTGDLSASMGLREKLLIGDSQARERINECREKVLDACRAYGIPVSQVPYKPEEVSKLKSEGINIFLTVPETFFFHKTLKDFIDRAQKRLSEMKSSNINDQIELSYGKIDDDNGKEY